LFTVCFPFGFGVKNSGELLNRSRGEDQQKSTRAQIAWETACNYLTFCKKYLIKHILSRMSFGNIDSVEILGRAEFKPLPGV